jgi:hypothetical protein
MSIKYQVSSIKYQVSSIKYQVSSIKYQVSSIKGRFLSWVILSIAPFIFGCAAPLLLAAGGTGLMASDSAATDVKKLTAMTAKQYGVDTSKVQVSNVKQEPRGFFGTVGGAPVEVSFEAMVNNRQLRCIALVVGEMSGGGGNVNCAQPGSPIKPAL